MAYSKEVDYTEPHEGEGDNIVWAIRIGEYGMSEDRITNCPFQGHKFGVWF